MDAMTNARVSSHTRRHGLTRMPAFENLAAVTHFQRTKPHVSSWFGSLPPSLAIREFSYDESHNEGRAFSPTLPIVQSVRPTKTSTPANRNKILANDIIWTPATSSPARSQCQTIHNSSSPETDISASRSTPVASIRSDSRQASYDRSEIICMEVHFRWKMFASMVCIRSSMITF